MNSLRVAVIGAGGFGRETLDVIRAINAQTHEAFVVVGVLDDAPSALNLERLSQFQTPYLGAVHTVTSLPPEVQIVVAVGTPQARATIATRLRGWGRRSPSLIHPTVAVGNAAKFGEGLIACAAVSLGTNVRLGAHVHLNPHAVIGHDAELKDTVSVNPNATVSGECCIEARVLLGAGSVVLQGLSVGEDSVVGAGACVVNAVGSATTVVGVPAKELSDA